MNTITGAALLLLAAICLYLARCGWLIGKKKDYANKNWTDARKLDAQFLVFAFAVTAALYAALGVAFLLK